MKTVWVFGDQLHPEISSLRGATPADTRLLMVRSQKLVGMEGFHKQRLHLVLTAMRRFAAERRAEGFEVDERDADGFRAGYEAHVREFQPETVSAMAPLHYEAHQMLESLDVEIVPSNQMLCTNDEFAQWQSTQKNLLLENFYRFQRKRLEYLMEGNEPAGGQWNYDHDNREPPPKGPHTYADMPSHELDDLDREVIASLPESAIGAEPTGIWCTSRAQALEHLRRFIDEVLPDFGPLEDAMVAGEPRMHHAMLSHCLNIGLLLPGEVADAVEQAYRSGNVPINSAEGFMRQIIGWREYVWHVYWSWMPDYKDNNFFDNKRALPPLFDDPSKTEMNCMRETVGAVHEYAYAHHIQRLMILANFFTLAGVVPQEVVRWMRVSFIDGADWVMYPNVLGLGMYADGGKMSTKPYVAGGAYVNRMSNYCKGCKYNPKKRTGDDACPFTTLYWDFMSRHKAKFAQNFRMAQPLRNLERLSDIDEVRARGREVLKLLDAGEL